MGDHGHEPEISHFWLHKKKAASPQSFLGVFCFPTFRGEKLGAFKKKETAPVLTRPQEKLITKAIMQKFNFRRLTAPESLDMQQEFESCVEATRPGSFSDALVKDLRRAVQIQASLKYTYRSKGKFLSEIRSLDLRVILS